MNINILLCNCVITSNHHIINIHFYLYYEFYFMRINNMQQIYQ